MKKAASISSKKIMELIEEQNFRCALSDRKLTPETASLDHIIPLSRGGSHEIDNLWVVEHLVNSAKGTMTVDEFIAMCSDVTSHQNLANSANEHRYLGKNSSL